MRVRTVFAIAIGAWLGTYAGALFAATHTVTLTGRLFTEGEPDTCRFFLDPEGESQSVTLSANLDSYLCDFLSGSANRNTRFVVTLTPE